MIPKVIHYCWFGKGKMNALSEKCIESWKIFLPDYELKLWNEENFDLESNIYAKEAYHSKKYAFVSDYVRLYALLHEGGIYMDTDVEVVKNLDQFLNLPAFCGFETDNYIQTGLIASEKNGKWIQEQISYYKDLKFINSDGSFNIKTNVQTISKSMAENGFILKNSYQIYKDCMHIFPKDYFCAKERSGVLKLTENTVCIHHFNGSWISGKDKIKKIFFKKIIGPKITSKLILLKKKVFKKSK
jgi:mannosyltransferase OCH1-like enzyme